MIEALLRGASLLACGGGLKFNDQKKLAAGKKFKLLKPNKLNDSDWCVTVSEVGAANAPVMVKTKLLEAIKLLESKTGKKIKALLPPEIGQEAIVIDAANISGLPVVDTDLAGCRAVPRLSDTALIKQGLNFTISPLVVFNAAGRMKFLGKQKNLAKDELKVRSLVPKNQVVTLVGGLLPARTIKSKLNFNSYSLAIELGQALLKEKPLKKILPTKVLLGPVTIGIKKIKVQPSAGFDSKIVTVSVNEERGQLVVENEYMSLTLLKQSFAFPQLIMIFDPRLSRGVHSSELKVGKDYQLVVGDPFSFGQ